jgi:hypothetical protein
MLIRPEPQPRRLAVRDHHRRSLCGKSPAQSEQWCCSIGRRPIISGSAENRASPAMSAIHQRPCRHPCRDPGTRPELRIPNVAAHTRRVSVARIRPDSRKSARPFKGIICADVSEFESYMASHAVGSPPARLDYSIFLLWRGAAWRVPRPGRRCPI